MTDTVITIAVAYVVLLFVHVWTGDRAVRVGRAHAEPVAPDGVAGKGSRDHTVTM